MADRLVIDTAVNPVGITTGMDAAVREVARGVSGMQREAEKFRIKPDALVPSGLGPTAAKRGTEIAETLIASLTNTFERQATDAREALARGLISEEEYKRRGQEAAREFNRGILGGLDEIGASGDLTGFLREKLVRELRDVGQEAGDAARKAIEDRLKNAGAGLERLGRELSIGITAPIVGLGAAAYHFSTQYETALTGVAKTTGLAGAELAEFGRQVRALSEEAGFGRAPDLAGVAALGAQLGIAQDQLLDFTRVIRATEVATDLTADAAATMFAQFANITRMPQEQMSNLASTLVELGNTSAATESRILEMAQRLAGAGAQIGLAQSDIVGFAAALASLGVEAEAGGTAFSRVFARLGSAAKSGGDDLERFAALAGQSAADFAASFNEAPADAIAAFIAGIGRAAEEGQNVFAILESIGMDDMRLRDALLRTAGSGDLLARSLRTASGAFAENKALMQEFAPFAATLANQMAQVATVVQNVAGEFGDELGPAFRDAAKAARDLLPHVRTAVQMFGAMPAPLQKTVIALAGISAAAGPSLMLVGNLAQSLVVLRSASLAAAASQRILATAQATQGTAAAGAAAANMGLVRALGGLATGPAAPIVLGIAAITAAIHQMGAAGRDAKEDVEAMKLSAITMSPQQRDAEIAGAQDAIRYLERQRDEIMRRVARARQLGMEIADAPTFAQRVASPLARELHDTNVQIDRYRDMLRPLTEARARDAEATRRQTEMLGGFREEMEKLLGLQGMDAFGGGGFGTDTLTDRIARLAELRDLGIATQDELGSIKGIIADLKREYASLGDSAKDQTRRVEIQKQIEALTRKTSADAKVKATLELETSTAREQFDKLVREARGTIIRLNVVQSFDGSHEEFVRAAREAQVAEAEITAEIERRGGARATDIFAVRELLDLQRELRESTSIPMLLKARTPQIIPLKPVIVPGTWEGAFDPIGKSIENLFLGNIANAAKALEDAIRDVDLARIAGDTDRLKAAEERLAAVREEAERLAQQVAAFAFTVPGGTGIFGKVLQDLIDKLRGAKKETNSLAQGFRSFANATRGALQIADAFGEVDDSIRRSVDGLAGMLAGIADAREGMDALKKKAAERGGTAGWGDLFKTPTGLASLVTMIGGAAGLLGGLFNQGPSPAELALKSNTEALERLRRDIRDLGASLGDMRAVSEAVTRIPFTGLADKLGGMFGKAGIQVEGKIGEINVARINEILADTGLSFEDLKAIAEDYGITLVADGKLVIGALNDLAEYADLSRQAALRFKDTLSDLTQRSSAYMDLFNLEGPAAAWDEAMNVAAKLLPPQIAKEIAAFDIDTAAGRDAARQYLQRLFTEADTGIIDPAIVDAFGGIKEFVDFLLFVEQPIDDLADAATEAAGALRNIPTGFKLDLRRWQAMQAEVPPALTAPRPYVPPPPPTRDRVPPGGTPDGGRDRVEVYRFDNITIVGTDKTAGEIFDEVTSEARRRALATKGTTAAAWEAIN